MKQIFRFVSIMSSIFCMCVRAQEIIQANKSILAEQLIVTVKQGKLRGRALLSRNGSDYRGFLNIPYAKPPIGNLRFQSPQKPDSWEGERDSTIEGEECPHISYFLPGGTIAMPMYMGTEDCLSLNVYAPYNVSSLSKLPVLVFIHGGSFESDGGFNHLPIYFMDNNITLVTFNYRLGAFGFLSTADSIMPGNYGMKDQVEALKWIKENIAVFGGNPELVTIFGSEAGGAAVHLHMYSPLSAGLFQRAISQSGSAFSLWARVKPCIIRKRTIALGVLVGCPAMASSAILLECLRKVPSVDLVLAYTKFHVYPYEPNVVFSVVPESRSVEGAFIYEDPMIGSPINIVPWMTGINSKEGGFNSFEQVMQNIVNTVNSHYKVFLPIYMNFVNWLDYFECARIAEAAKKFYFHDEEIGIATIDKYSDMFTDILYFYPAIEGMSRYKSTVYFYYFDHRNAISNTEVGVANGSSEFTKANVTYNYGVVTYDELASLMPLLDFSTGVISEGPDLNVSIRMIERWITFARTGNPSIGNQTFDPFVASEVNYLHITTTKDEMKKGLHTDRLSFWRKTLPLPGGSSNTNKLQSTKMGVCLSLFLLFQFLS